jgi:hypothetical protein
MKVLVPIDVQSTAEVAATLNTIFDSAWPDDVEFYLLNVIEDDFPGSPCEKPTCVDRCHCLEPRVNGLSDVMRKLENKMPGVPIYIEVMKGNLQDKVDAWKQEQPGGHIITPRPVRKRLHAHPVAMAAVVITIVSAALAVLLLGFETVPAGGFVPIPPMVPMPVQAPHVMAQPAPAYQRPSKPELLLDIYSRLGDSSVDNDSYAPAVFYYKQALTSFDQAHGNQAQRCSITSGLSIAYCGLRQMSNAIKYGRMSVDAALNESPRDKTDVSVAYNNLGYLRKKMGNLIEAEKMYEAALNWAPLDRSEQRMRAAAIETNLGDIYGLNNKMPKAFASYRHALDVFKRECAPDHPAIEEVQQKIHHLQVHHKVLLSNWPMTITIIQANI